MLLANARCNPENLIEQLKNGVRAMQMPVENLLSNWAYMVMASPAWTPKAWFALLLPQAGRWATTHKAEKQSVLKMEFKRLVNAFVRVPCQVVRSGRRIVYRLLAWNPWQPVFLRGVDALRCSLRCRVPLWDARKRTSRFARVIHSAKVRATDGEKAIARLRLDPQEDRCRAFARVRQPPIRWPRRQYDTLVLGLVLGIHGCPC